MKTSNGMNFYKHSHSSFSIRYSLFFLLIVFFGLFGLAKSSQGATIIAASCSQADVQTAVDSASDGDVVAMPAGNCTWAARGGSGAGSKNGLYINNKQIYLKGAGKNLTVITDGTTSSDWNAGLIYITGSKNFEISDFTITGHVYHGISAYISARDWKIHDMKLVGKTNQKLTGIYIEGINNGTPYGIVYKCEFIDSKVDYMGRGTADWLTDSPLGTANTNFIEDCTFSRTADDSGLAVDSNNGGRWVVRHNTFDDTHVFAHALGTAPRGSRFYEIYNNVFRAMLFNDNGWIGINSGSAVVYNNEVRVNTGKTFWYFDIELQYERSCPYGTGSGFVDYGTGYDWHTNYLCDGSYASDGNLGGGYPCRDQPGRGKDLGVYPSAQTDYPVYIWSNYKYSGLTGDNGKTLVGGHVYNSEVPPPQGCANAAVQTQINRDWYESELSYTPYPYPHPLRAEAMPDTTPPSPPSGVTVN